MSQKQINQKILVTGSNGFIGSEVLSYLRKKRYNVIGITEDVRDMEALKPHFKDIEFVIHTAGQTKEAKNQDDYYTTNVLGTKNVIELCLENNSKLIHLGSVAVSGFYGLSKWESQKLIEENCNNRLKAIVLRLVPIYNKSDISKKRGRIRYSLEDLVEDIENIIKSHNFNEYKLLDYENL